MNAPTVELIQMTLDCAEVKKDDEVVIDGHFYMDGLSHDLLSRPAGVYVVLYVFASGNVFAKMKDSTLKPQVIPAYYIVRKL